MAFIELHDSYRTYLFVALISKDLATHGFQKKIKPTEAKPESSASPLQIMCTFPAHLRVYVIVLTTNLLPLTSPGLRPTVQILASMKICRA